MTESAPAKDAAVPPAASHDALRLSLLDLLLDSTDPERTKLDAVRHLGRHLRADGVVLSEVGPDGVHVTRDGVRPSDGKLPDPGHVIRVEAGDGTGASRFSMEALRREGGDWTPEEVALLKQSLDWIRRAVIRARTVDALRLSEDHFRHMVELTPTVPWTARPDGLVDFAPRRWSEWTGGSGLGEGWMEAVHPADLPRVLQVWERSLTTGSLLDQEFRIRRHGEYAWIRSRAFPRRDENGRIVKWYGSLEDVHDKKLSEQALRRSEEFHRFAVEAGRIGTWDMELDPFGCVVSPVMAQIMGFTATHTRLTAEQWQSAIVPEDYPHVVASLTRAVKNGDYVEAEFRVRHSDGSLRWLFARGGFDRDASGRATRLHGGCIDVTERRVTEEALRQAKTAAEEANRTKDEFLATVSHELRTPLAAILLWSRQISSNAIRPHELTRAVRAIQQSAEMQSRLIADLLDLSRMIAGQLRLRQEPTDIAALARGSVELIRPTAEAKQIRLNLEVDDQIHTLVDPSRIQQLLGNLLGNALKFTPVGGEVTLRLNRQGEQIILSVADTGQGIAPDFLPHVFERFRQAEMKESRQQPGLGIGLALCRSVVELHRGAIRAESPGLDRGATFTVVLPFVAPEPASHPAMASGPAQHPPSLGGLRLLLVEDDATTRDALVWTLERAGASVIPVSSGHEALEAIASAAPHVMVCDIGLPGMDGYELIQRAHALEEARGRPPIPACALSAYSREADRRRALEAGFDLYLSKPVEPEVLLDAVDELANVAQHEEDSIPPFSVSSTAS